MGLENRIETTQVGRVGVVTLYGEHDLATEPALRSVVEALARPGACIIIDTAPATFIDATVLHAMVYASQNADALAIVAPEGEQPRRLLDLAGSDRLLATCSSQDHALRHVLAQTEPLARPTVETELETADRLLDAAWATGDGIDAALAHARRLPRRSVVSR